MDRKGDTLRFFSAYEMINQCTWNTQLYIFICHTALRTYYYLLIFQITLNTTFKLTLDPEVQMISWELTTDRSNDAELVRESLILGLSAAAEETGFCSLCRGVGGCRQASGSSMEG